MDRYPVHGLPVSDVEIVEQDPPGHDVNDKMMCDEEEIRSLLRASCEQHGLEQRAGREVEARVHVVGDLLHDRLLLAGVDLGEVTSFESRGATGAMRPRHSSLASSNCVRRAS